MNKELPQQDAMEYVYVPVSVEDMDSIRWDVNKAHNAGWISSPNGWLRKVPLSTLLAQQSQPAKGDAIEFAEWMGRNRYYPEYNSINGFKYEWTRQGSYKHFSTEQLYQLFKGEPEAPGKSVEQECDRMSAFQSVLKTLKKNKVMVSTEDDGIYIRMAGNVKDGECFSLEWSKVVSFTSPSTDVAPTYDDWEGMPDEFEGTIIKHDGGVWGDVAIQTMWASYALNKRDWDWARNHIGEAVKVRPYKIAYNTVEIINADVAPVTKSVEGEVALTEAVNMLDELGIRLPHLEARLYNVQMKIFKAMDLLTPSNNPNK